MGSSTHWAGHQLCHAPPAGQRLPRSPQGSPRASHPTCFPWGLRGSASRLWFPHRCSHAVCSSAQRPHAPPVGQSATPVTRTRVWYKLHPPSLSVVPPSAGDNDGRSRLVIGVLWGGGRGGLGGGACTEALKTYLNSLELATGEKRKAAHRPPHPLPHHPLQSPISLTPPPPAPPPAQSSAASGHPGTWSEGLASLPQAPLVGSWLRSSQGPPRTIVPSFLL